jgi:hypothetical protein
VCSVDRCLRGQCFGALTPLGRDASSGQKKKKMKRTGEDGLNALADAADALEMVDEDQVEVKQARDETKKILVPVAFINLIRTTFKAPSFGSQGGGRATAATWRKVALRIESGESEGDLQACVDELEAELAALKLTTIDTARSRNSFQVDFGVASEFFDWLYEKCDGDLVGQGRENIFTAHAEGTKYRARGVSVSDQDVLGVTLRRVCCLIGYEQIGRDIGKTGQWARKLIETSIASLADDSSQFSRQFLRPQNPVELWEWIKENRDDVVEFVKDTLGDDYHEDSPYFVIALDGVHFEGKTVADFLLHLLSRSEKKAANTLLSVVGCIHSMWASFISDLAFGHTSEPALVKMTNILDTIYTFAVGNGAEAVIFVTDKVEFNNVSHLIIVSGLSVCARLGIIQRQLSCQDANQATTWQTVIKRREPTCQKYFVDSPVY